jgi:putative heme-binding domain-containing protein
VAADLLTIAAAATAPVELRLDALNAIAEGPGEIDDRLFTLLIGQLDPEGPITPRLAAADALVKSRLNPAQLGKIAEALKDAGPLESGRLLVLFDAVTDEKVGKTLVNSLMESPGVGSLRVDALKPHFAKFGAAVQTEAAALYRRIEQESADQKAALDALQASLPAGDVRRGQEVFNGSKAACVSCHAIGYLGGQVGPDLSRVGAIREERDLLEAVVYPSASFVRSYEPIQVATASGQVYSGVLRRDAPDEVVLAAGADQEVRIPRGEIEEMLPSTVSVMPAGLDKQLSRQELADLIAFLRSRK